MTYEQLLSKSGALRNGTSVAHLGPMCIFTTHSLAGDYELLNQDCAPFEDIVFYFMGHFSDISNSIYIYICAANLSVDI